MGKTGNSYYDAEDKPLTTWDRRQRGEIGEPPVLLAAMMDQVDPPRPVPRWDEHTGKRIGHYSKRVLDTRHTQLQRFYAMPASAKRLASIKQLNEEFDQLLGD